MQSPAEHVALIIFFSLMAILFNWIAIKNNFYKLPQVPVEINIPFLHVVGAFAVYIFTAFFLPSTLLHYLKKLFLAPFENTPSSLYAGTQLLSIFFCFFFSGYFPLFSKKTLVKKFGNVLTQA